MFAFFSKHVFYCNVWLYGSQVSIENVSCNEFWNGQSLINETGVILQHWIVCEQILNSFNDHRTTFEWVTTCTLVFCTFLLKDLP
jgi:hypothetical protein